MLHFTIPSLHRHKKQRSDTDITRFRPLYYSKVRLIKVKLLAAALEAVKNVNENIETVHYFTSFHLISIC